MSINNVSNYFGKDYAADFKEKWGQKVSESQSQLEKLGISVPVGQPTANKQSENMTGLQVEKSDVTADHVDRKLTSDEAIKSAETEARKEYYQYGTEDGKTVKYEDNVFKMAENYVENEKHKEDVQSTQVFMDKKEYKAAEKQRKAEYKEMYNRFREEGHSKKEAKQMAKDHSVENEYVSGRKTRKFVEDNKDYFYDENGKFSSDKFKQKAVEYANINTKKDETLNYHLSLRERRAAAQMERVDSSVIKNIAKKANLDYEKDNTNLYRGAFIGGVTAVSTGIGALFSVSASAAAAAGSSSSAAATTGTGAATGAASSAAAATATASVNGSLVGAGAGLAAGTGGSTFLRDKGKIEDRIYAPGKPQEPKVQKPSTEPDTPVPPVQPETQNPTTPVVENPCPTVEWAESYCDHNVKKGQNWSTVILGKVKVNDKKPQGNVLKALIHAEKIKHGVTNFKLNTMPSTMRLYTDYSDLFENAEIMKKYPELRYLKDATITVNCDGKVASNKYNGRPRIRYTRYTGTPMETNTYKQDCHDQVPVRTNNK